MNARLRCVRPLLATIVVVLALAVPLAYAGEAQPLAPDEATEQRLVAISSELRCLVCQNESLAGSQAELANDLRREIRTMIEAGQSDQQIIDFMVARYGDFVLYRPPVKGVTLLLWGGPVLLLLIGLIALVRYLKRRAVRVAAQEAPLSADEARRADALLKELDSK